jgi:hypothetical protein
MKLKHYGVNSTKSIALDVFPNVPPKPEIVINYGADFESTDGFACMDA